MPQMGPCMMLILSRTQTPSVSLFGVFRISRRSAQHDSTRDAFSVKRAPGGASQLRSGAAQ